MVLVLTLVLAPLVLPLQFDVAGKKPGQLEGIWGGEFALRLRCPCLPPPWTLCVLHGGR